MTKALTGSKVISLANFATLDFEKWPRECRFETNFLVMEVARGRVIYEQAGIQVYVFSPHLCRFMETIVERFEMFDQLPARWHSMNKIQGETNLAVAAYRVSAIVDRSKYVEVYGEHECDATPYQSPERLLDPGCYTFVHTSRMVGFIRDCLQEIDDAASAWKAFATGGLVSNNLAIYEKFYDLVYFATSAHIDPQAALPELERFAPSTSRDTIIALLNWCASESARPSK